MTQARVVGQFELTHYPSLQKNHAYHKQKSCNTDRYNSDQLKSSDPNLIVAELINGRASTQSTYRLFGATPFIA